MVAAHMVMADDIWTEGALSFNVVSHVLELLGSRKDRHAYGLRGNMNDN